MTQDWLTVASPQLQVKTWSALVNIQYRSKVSYKSCLYAIARYENRVVRYRKSRSARRKPRSRRRDSRLARGWWLTFERYCSSYFFSPKFFFKVSIWFCNSFNNFNNSLNSKTTVVLIRCFLIEQSSYTWREELRTNNVKAKTCLFTGQVDVQHMPFTYATYNPDSRDNNLCDKRILPITSIIKNWIIG